MIDIVAGKLFEPENMLVGEMMLGFHAGFLVT